MSVLPSHRHGQGPAGPADERAIRSLSARSGVALPQVRRLFRHEFDRLGMGAKVGSYLAVLTASNVRAVLMRKARLADAPSPAERLERWEDDGGRVADGANRRLA